jgi:signal transduction histidine kinase
MERVANRAYALASDHRERVFPWQVLLSAFGLSGMALGLTAVVHPVVASTLLLFPYAATVAGAWLAGLRGAVTTAVFCALGIDYFFLAPVHSIVVGSTSGVVLVTFLAMSVVIGLLTEKTRANEKRLGAQKYEAEASRNALAHLYALIMRLSRSNDRADIAGVVLAEATRFTGCEKGSFAVLSEDGTQLQLIESVGYGNKLREAWPRYPVKSSPLTARAFEQGAAEFVESAAEYAAKYAPMHAIAREFGVASVAAIPLQSASGIVGMLAVASGRDHTFTPAQREFLILLAQQAASALERVDLLEREKAARRDADGANKTKAEFLASISHELRTPLNAIQGYLQLLETGVFGRLTEQQVSVLQRVGDAGRRLLSLIEDVLQFARIEAGQLRIDVRAFEVEPTIDVACRVMGPQTTHHELDFVCGECAGVSAEGDPDRVQQILLNLLSNAFKFTPVGGIIRMKCRASTDHVEISVEDSGRGIPEEKLGTIFEPYGQVDPKTDQALKGTGLGLSISRDLARAMGGELTVQSKFGEGSTFTLRLKRVGWPADASKPDADEPSFPA